MTEIVWRRFASTLFFVLAAACSSSDGALSLDVSMVDGGSEWLGNQGVFDSDGDGDGVADIKDNCPDIANPEQRDTDADSIGDACDNCLEVANVDQVDDNGDGTGNECQNPIDRLGDADGDGVANDTDNCWRVADAMQQDADGDGVGDVCDNCPAIANFDQLDSNADRQGDACATNMSADSDGDGVEDSLDNCDQVANSEQQDADKDLIGDVCDNCSQVANYDQADSDKNGVGDACEGGGAGGWDPALDSDGDGIPDISDNCRTVKNANQTDTDGDGVGEACDNCLSVANYTQDDLDNNGVGDACEIPPATTPACAEETVSGTIVRPNLYLVLDSSGSMDWAPCDCNQNGCNDCPGACSYCGTTRWAELQSGLDALSTDFARDFNVGIAAFPTTNGRCDVSMPDFELLDLKPGWTAAQIRAAYSGITPDGRTPAQQALDQVRTSALHSFASDTIPSRPKVVVLITDGEPNCGGDVSSTALAAEDLYKAGVPVYVIGFSNLNPVDMDVIAEHGQGLPRTPGQVDWFPVTDRTSIAAALSAITSSLVSCSVALALDGDEDLSRIRVETVIDNQTTAISRDGYDFNAGTGTVTLLGNACTTLKNAASSGSTVSVRARAACACVPEEEVCDYADNDCDGVVDEGCMSCPDEVCDGQDNDCDGQVDEGCPPPGCTPRPEICDGLDNDCDDQVDEGCPPRECVPSKEICDGIDNDCDGQADEGCINQCRPMSEICDGKDNDCDGKVDEGCPMNTIR